MFPLPFNESEVALDEKQKIVIQTRLKFLNSLSNSSYNGLNLNWIINWIELSKKHTANKSTKIRPKTLSPTKKIYIWNFLAIDLVTH